MNEPFDQRRNWFMEYCSNQENKAIIRDGQSGVFYPCPCCGYPTLNSRGKFDICELCNWEDDGQDDPYADEVWGGPNGRYSLTHARENFKQYLIMYHPDDNNRRIGGVQNSDIEHQAKQGMVNAYDAMIREASPSKIEHLWKVIEENKAVLRAEIDRRIREFEKNQD